MLPSRSEFSRLSDVEMLTLLQKYQSLLQRKSILERMQFEYKKYGHLSTEIRDLAAKVWRGLRISVISAQRQPFNPVPVIPQMIVRPSVVAPAPVPTAPVKKTLEQKQIEIDLAIAILTKEKIAIEKKQLAAAQPVVIPQPPVVKRGPGRPRKVQTTTPLVKKAPAPLSIEKMLEILDKRHATLTKRAAEDKLPVASQQDFIDRVLGLGFLEKHQNYTAKKNQKDSKGLAPAVIRINDQGDYTAPNLTVVTQAEACRARVSMAQAAYDKYLKERDTQAPITKEDLVKALLARKNKDQ